MKVFLEGVYDFRVKAVVLTKPRLQGANRSRSGATARICNAADGVRFPCEGRCAHKVTAARRYLAAV